MAGSGTAKASDVFGCVSLDSDTSINWNGSSLNPASFHEPTYKNGIRAPVIKWMNDGSTPAIIFNNGNFVRASGNDAVRYYRLYNAAGAVTAYAFGTSSSTSSNIIALAQAPNGDCCFLTHYDSMGTTSSIGTIKAYILSGVDGSIVAEFDLPAGSCTGSTEHVRCLYDAVNNHWVAYNCQDGLNRKGYAGDTNNCTITTAGGTKGVVDIYTNRANYGVPFIQLSHQLCTPLADHVAVFSASTINDYLPVDVAHANDVWSFSYINGAILMAATEYYSGGIFGMNMTTTLRAYTLDVDEGAEWLLSIFNKLSGYRL